jgi:molybdate transport system ATP-binding protein
VLFDSAEDQRSPRVAAWLMFQHYALFPNMTVEENVLCALSRAPRPLRRGRALDWIARMHLTEQRGLYPAQLSGGQRQRVALARMLASEPRLVLMDEPFSALDSHLRWQLEREVLEALRDFPGTALMVSHNRDEAFRMCDRIAVMEDGRVSAAGPRRALFDHPVTRAAAVMTGCKNVARAEKAGPNRLTVPDWGCALDTWTGARGSGWAGVRKADCGRAGGPRRQTAELTLLDTLRAPSATS